MTESSATLPGTGTSPLPVVRSPLVGRDGELTALDGALAKALSSHTAQLVTIVGGGGVGKSRLIDEVVARIKGRERRVRVFRAAAREGGPSFGVIQRLLRARFSLPETSEPEMARELLRGEVTTVLGDRRVAEFLHFLGLYLDLTFPESPFVKAFEDDQDQVARMSRAVLRRFFEIDASASPLVLVLEDLHHAGDDTLALIRSLLDSMQGAPCLLIATARPELLVRRPDWFEGPSAARHTRIELAPLDPERAAQMMLHLLDKTGDPPEALIEAATDMAAGSPLLLEQMVRIYFETGTLSVGEGGAWTVHLDKLDGAELPLSIEDTIAARIAALAPAERALLERAAVMGGVFWLGALVSASRLSKAAPPLWGGAEDIGAHYRDLLQGLADREYVMLLPDASIAGEMECAFKHNLEREALYKLLGARLRQEQHLTVAEWLDARASLREGDAPSSGPSEEMAEMIAEHYEKGNAKGRAADFYLLAADRARSRYANTKAADLYGRAFGLAGADDQDAEQQVTGRRSDVLRRIDGLHNWGDVLQLAGKNDEAIEVFRKMQQLAWRLDLKTKGGVAHNRIGRVYRAIGRLEDAMRHLGTGHALFDAAGDQRGIASSLDDVGKVHWMRGAYDAAERFALQGLEIRRELGDPRSISLSLNNLGLVYHDSGRFTEATTTWEEALEIRRGIGDRPGLSQTLNNLASTFQDTGDHARATELWTEALELSRQVGDRMRTAVVLTNLGESYYRQGAPERAIEVLREAERLSSTLGDRILEGEILRGLAKAHMLTNHIAEARDFIGRSIQRLTEAKGKPFLGVALRTAGEIESAGGWGDGDDHKKARSHFADALTIFEDLGNQVELARTCLAYAAFLESDPGSKTDPIRMHEIQRLRSRADEVEGKLVHASSSGGLASGGGASIEVAVDEVAPIEGEATNPG
jgi:tetratricopeptide (TPR) repeat protein